MQRQSAPPEEEEEKSWTQWGRNVMLGAAKEVGIQGSRLAAYTNLTDQSIEEQIESLLADWVHVSAQSGKTERIKVTSVSGGFEINAFNLVLQPKLIDLIEQASGFKIVTKRDCPHAEQLEVKIYVAKEKRSTLSHVKIALSTADYAEFQALEAKRAKAVQEASLSGEADGAAAEREEPASAGGFFSSPAGYIKTAIDGQLQNGKDYLFEAIANISIDLRDVQFVLCQNHDELSRAPFKGLVYAQIDNLEFQHNSETGKSFDLQHISLAIKMYGLEIKIGEQDLEGGIEAAEKAALLWTKQQQQHGRGGSGSSSADREWWAKQCAVFPVLQISRDDIMEGQTRAQSREEMAGVTLELKDLKKIFIAFNFKSFLLKAGGLKTEGDKFVGSDMRRIVGLAEKQEDLVSHEDLVQCYFTNIDRSYLRNIEGKAGSKDTLHAAVLKANKEFLMSEKETELYFGTLHLSMPISLQFLVLHNKLIQAVSFLSSQLPPPLSLAEEEVKLKASEKASEKTQEQVLQQQVKQTMSTEEVKKIIADVLAYDLQAVHADRAKRAIKSGVLEREFSPHNICVNTELKRQLLEDRQAFEKQQALADDLKSNYCKFDLSQDPEDSRPKYAEITIDLEDVYLLNKIEIANPLVEIANPLEDDRERKKYCTSEIEILGCSEYSSLEYHTVISKTDTGENELIVDPEASLKKVQFLKIRLYGEKHVGLWYVQCYGRLFGLGRALGIHCKIASPELILPGRNRSQVNSVVDCIVINPGTVTVDNHGTYVDKLLVYNGQQQTAAKHKNAFTITVSPCLTCPALFYLAKFRWLQDGVGESGEPQVLKLEGKKERIIYISPPQTALEASPQMHMRFIGGEFSKFETMMLPKHSVITCRFDQAHLNRFTECLQVLTDVSDEERKFMDLLNTVAVAEALLEAKNSVWKDIHRKDRHQNLVSMKVRLRHSVQFIYKAGFTASVTAMSPQGRPLKVDLVEGEVRISFQELIGQLPYREEQILNETDEEAAMEKLKKDMQAAVKKMQIVDQSVEETEAHKKANVDKLRLALWKDINRQCNASPLIARKVAGKIQKQIASIENPRKEDDILIYSKDEAFLRDLLSKAEQQSCVIQLRAYNPTGADDKKSVTDKACKVIFNASGKGNTKVELPFLRCGVKMLGESNIDFENLVIKYTKPKEVVSKRPSTHGEDEDEEAPAAKTVKSAKVTISANELSITSRIHESVPATWLTITLDPESKFVTYQLSPEANSPAVSVSFGEHDSILKSLTTLRNAADGRGHSIIDVAWTMPAIGNLMDTVAAFGKAFSNGGKDLNKEQQPFHYEIVNLNRAKLNLSNLTPSLGYLNRSGIHIGIWNYKSNDSPSYNTFKTLWLAFWFMISNDYFSAGLGGIMFLYASLQCTESEKNIEENTHRCPSQAVSLSSGLLVVVVAIWMMPPMLHALTGRTMRAYGLAAGLLTVLVFCFKAEEGIDWVYEVFTNPDSDIIFNFVTFWIVLFSGLMCLTNMEHWSSPSSKLLPPAPSRLFVKHLWIWIFGLLGAVQILIIFIDQATQDFAREANTEVQFEDTGKHATGVGSMMMMFFTLIVMCKGCCVQWLPGTSLAHDSDARDREPLINRKKKLNVSAENFDIAASFLETSTVSAITKISGQSKWEIILGAFLLLSLFSCWIWNGFELDWRLPRRATKGDNVTFDTARNFYVFGWIMIGWTFALIVGVLLELNSSAQARKRDEKLKEMEIKRIQGLQATGITAEFVDTIPEEWKDPSSNQIPDEWEKFLKKQGYYSDKQNMDPERLVKLTKVTIAEYSRFKLSWTETGDIRRVKSAGTGSTDSTIQQTEPRRATELIPADQFVDATDAGCDWTDTGFGEMDMDDAVIDIPDRLDQRATDYTGDAHSPREQVTPLVSPQHSQSNYGAVKPVIPLQPAVMIPLSDDVKEDGDDATGVSIPTDEHAVQDRNERIGVPNRVNKEIPIYPGYTIKWNWQIADDSPAGHDVGFYVQLVNDDREILSAGLGYPSPGTRMKAAEGTLNIDILPDVLEQAHWLQLCFDNSFSYYAHKYVSLTWDRISNGDTDVSSPSAASNRTTADMDESLPLPQMGDNV